MEATKEKIPPHMQVLSMIHGALASQALLAVAELRLADLVRDGKKTIALVFCYCGPQEEGERLVAPIRSIGTPLMEVIRPASYLEVISMFDASMPCGRHYYSKTRSLKRLDDQALEALLLLRRLALHGHMRVSVHSVAGEQGGISHPKVGDGGILVGDKDESGGLQEGECPGTGDRLRTALHP